MIIISLKTLLFRTFEFRRNELVFNPEAHGWNNHLYEIRIN
jgi:hypothetical protein